MSLTCLPHTKNCTRENALNWGMCRSHFYQVRIQSQLESRIVHLVLAILEVIPVIGQIVSLIELRVIQFYARPQPTSCIPRIATLAFQESRDDIRRIWPADLKLLGITETQKIEIDRHIRDAFRARTMSFSKKRLKYGSDPHSVDAALPISLTIFKENGTFRVLLFPKTVFASGGERKIRWVYDLTTGTFLLKKRIVGLFEEKILHFLLAHRLQRDIKTFINWRTSSDKQNKPKRQIIEPVRDGTLEILFGTAPLSNFSVKRGLIMDLLVDLCTLHEGKISGVTVSSRKHLTLDGTPSTRELSYHPFHSDIKPLNVLIFFQNGGWRAELSDFGYAAAHPTTAILSYGFTPPEYIRFYKEQWPFGLENAGNVDNFEIAAFNTKYGRSRDTWSMALVILSLLVERQEKGVWKNMFNDSISTVDIPPLPCLKAILSGRIYSYYDEIGILSLKQETLDADLARLENEVAPKHPEERAELAKIFEMLKGMLRINPDERMSMDQCVAWMRQSLFS